MPYYGGKSRFGAAIAAHINRWIRRTGARVYFEPFFGMGGVTAHIESGLASGVVRVVCDANVSQMAMWRALLHRTQMTLPKSPISKEQWRRHKFGPNTPLKGFFGVAQSFGSNPYVGYVQDEARRVSQFNSTKAAIERLLPRLRGVVALPGASYTTFEPVGCVVYCDPPYANTRCFAMKETSKFDSAKFWDTMQRWSLRNLVFVSEASPRRGWRTVWMLASNKAGRLNKPRTEYLLMRGPKKLSASSIATSVATSVATGVASHKSGGVATSVPTHILKMRK